MDKKVILITGCSTGIGNSTAKYLHDLGHIVCATARDDRDVWDLKDYGLESYSLDVTDYTEMSKVLDEIMSRHSRIDVLFNNAGYGQPGAIEDLPTKILKEQFETNVFGLHELTRLIIPIMREQKMEK